jgi:hypothetical protein
VLETGLINTELETGPTNTVLALETGPINMELVLVTGLINMVLVTGQTNSGQEKAKDSEEVTGLSSMELETGLTNGDSMDRDRMMIKMMVRMTRLMMMPLSPEKVRIRFSMEMKSKLMMTLLLKHKKLPLKKIPLLLTTPLLMTPLLTTQLLRMWLVMTLQPLLRNECSSRVSLIVKGIT